MNRLCGESDVSKLDIIYNIFPIGRVNFKAGTQSFVIAELRYIEIGFLIGQQVEREYQMRATRKWRKENPQYSWESQSKKKSHNGKESRATLPAFIDNQLRALRRNDS